MAEWAVPHLHMDKLGGTTGEPDRPFNPAKEKKAPEPLPIKTVGVVAAGETPSLTGEFVGETHRLLERTQAHPPRNQDQQGPLCLWVAGEVTESWLRAKQVSLFPLGPLPHI